MATNQKASSALRGCDTLVTLNGSEALSVLPTVTLGQQATISSSSAVGYVSWIDSYGYSFKITPKTPALNLASSSTPGYLAAAETITLA